VYKHSHFLASFSLLRRVSTERAYCYKMLANTDYTNLVSKCLRMQKEISPAAHKTFPEQSLCFQVNCRLAQFLLMSIEMWLLYFEPTKMTFDHDKCFKIRTDVSSPCFSFTTTVNA
jgi:hypothetical protein